MLLPEGAPQSAVDELNRHLGLREPLWIQYGLVSRDAGDNAAAVRAFKHFLVLAPQDPDVGQIKALIKQLRAAGTVSTGTSSSITVGG